MNGISMKLLGKLSMVLALSQSIAVSAQEPGITENTIVIGRISAQGSPAFDGMARQRSTAADAYIARVNASGGIHGRKIVIKDRFDAYMPARTEQEIKGLIAQDKVFAILGAWGSPTLPIVMREAEAAGVPVVGAMTVSNEARVPVKRFIFPVRSSSHSEAATTVRHQLTIGVKRFAVLAGKEAYGPDGSKAYLDALAAAGVKPIDTIMFGATEDPAAVARKIHQTQAQSLLVAALPKPFAAVLKQYRNTGGTAQVFGFSAMRIDELQAELGEHAAGVMLTQVAPAPYRRLMPLTIEYQETLQMFAPQLKPSYHGLDAYLEARILVEALRAAGKQPTRARVVAALEGMRNRDFGGVIVRYGPDDRTGATYVDLLMLSSANKIVQ